MCVGPMLIVDFIFATYIKMQKSRNSPSQVVDVDKLNVCRGETPRSLLSVDMDDNTVTTSDGQPIKLGKALIADQSVRSPAGQPDDQLPTTVVPTIGHR